jgi:3-oxoacyl-[acyl-carrier-protein] synthase II
MFVRNGEPRRVVISGLGVLSSVGIGKERFWEAIKKGKSGIKPITLFNAETFPVRIAGEIKDFDPQDFFPYELSRRLDRFSLLGLAATRLAVEDAGYPTNFTGTESEETCVVVGTSVGAFGMAEEIHSVFIEKGRRRISPYFNTSVIPSSCATQIGMMLGLHGSVSTVTTACASGTSAIGEAFHLIRGGRFEIGIAGASEAPITPLVTATFSSVGLLSTDNEEPSAACRPFSKDRNGTVLAEGAAIVILEELNHALRRGAKIYGEVVGYGASFDSYHTMQPSPSADFAAKAISKALVDGTIKPEEVNYVNAHGSASLLNDKTETLAIKKAFGDHAYRLAVSSTKSMIGHTMGACGALEFVASVLVLENQYLHPTINLRLRDPECDLDYVPNVGRPYEVRTMLTNSTGFGGYNAACLVRRFNRWDLG